MPTRPGARQAALGAAAFLYWLSLYLYVPLLPGHARGLGATATWIGVITGVYGLVQLVLRLPAGIWSDRLGRRRPFVAGGCLSAAASGVVFALADGPTGLLVARTLAGIAATIWLHFTVLYTGFAPARAGAAMASIVFVNNAATLVAQVAGPYMAGRAGIEAVFWASAAAGASALLLALPGGEGASRSGKTPALRDLVAVTRHPTVLRVSLLAAVAQYLVHGGTFVFVNDWAQQRLGASAADLATLALVSGAPAALATLAVGTAAARALGPRRVVGAAFLVAAASAGVVPWLPDLESLYLSQAIGGAARGLMVPSLMTLALLAVPPERGATAVGFFQAAYSLGMTAGPLVTGLVADGVGLGGGFVVMALLGGAGAAAAWRALPGGPAGR